MDRPHGLQKITMSKPTEEYRIRIHIYHLYDQPTRGRAPVRGPALRPWAWALMGNVTALTMVMRTLDRQSGRSCGEEGLMFWTLYAHNYGGAEWRGCGVFWSWSWGVGWLEEMSFDKDSILH